jgi:hypothetical protein
LKCISPSLNVPHNIMKLTLASIVFAALTLQSAAWEFTFADDGTCLFTHGGQKGDGNKVCENIDPGDDSDHVKTDTLNGCIITFYEEEDCEGDELEPFDEGMLDLVVS